MTIVRRGERRVDEGRRGEGKGTRGEGGKGGKGGKGREGVS